MQQEPQCANITKLLNYDQVLNTCNNQVIIEYIYIKHKLIARNRTKRDATISKEKMLSLFKFPMKLHRLEP
jgi:hypothetical protein